MDRRRAEWGIVLSSVALCCCVLCGVGVAADERASVGAGPVECDVVVHAGERIQAAVDRMARGGVVCVESGVYREAVYVKGARSADRRLAIVGLNGRPVIDGAYSVPRVATGIFFDRRKSCPGVLPEMSEYAARGFAGPRRYDCVGPEPLLSVESGNVEVRNIEVRHSPGPGVVVGTDGGTIDGVVLSNLHVHENRGNGIFVRNAENVRIEDSDVSFNGNFAPFPRRSKDLDWGFGIGTFNGRNVVIARNRVHDNWGDAVLADINTGRSRDVSVSENDIYDNFATAGVYVHAMEGATVRGNRIHCSAESVIPSSSSIRLSASEPAYSQDIDTRTVEIADNAVSGCPGPAILIAGGDRAGRSISGVVIRHNRLSGPGRIVVDGAALDGLRVEN